MLNFIYSIGVVCSAIANIFCTTVKDCIYKRFVMIAVTLGAVVFVVQLNFEPAAHYNTEISRLLSYMIMVAAMAMFVDVW